MRVLFYIWNVTIIFLSSHVVITFWPDYSDNEFPLYTDLLTLLIVIPCFYLLCVGLPSQLFIVFMRSLLIRIALILVNFVIGMFVVIYLFPYHLKTSLLVSMFSLVYLSLYLFISHFLYYSSSINKSI